jgi:hypothetical protein
MPVSNKPTPWTKEAIANAKSMWASGHSAVAIAKALGFTRNAVLGKIHREGWPSPTAKLRTGFWSAEVTETAKRMWVAGDSVRIIAAAFGTTRGAVRNLAWRQRWPARQGNKRWTPEIVDTARRMRLAGDSIEVIAKALGFTPYATGKKASLNKWPRRRRIGSRCPETGATARAT